MKIIKRVGSILLLLSLISIFFQVGFIIWAIIYDISLDNYYQNNIIVVTSIAFGFIGMWFWVVGYLSHKPINPDKLTFNNIFWEYPE